VRALKIPRTRSIGNKQDSLSAAACRNGRREYECVYVNAYDQEESEFISHKGDLMTEF
jgi:hypothetical protein